MEERKPRRRFEVPHQPRFITCSCHQRRPFFDRVEERDRFVLMLARTRVRRRFRLHAWVVMPEHIHLVLTPSLPEHPMSRVLADLKGSFASMTLQRWRVQGHRRGVQRFWQPGGGYDRNLESVAAVGRKISYVHRNPVARGLVGSPTEWLWSSARWYAGNRGERDLVMDPIDGG